MCKYNIRILHQRYIEKLCQPKEHSTETFRYVLDHSTAVNTTRLHLSQTRFMISVHKQT